MERTLAKRLVTKALEQVADFTGDIEPYPTANFHDALIHAFLTALSGFIINEPVIDNNGNERPKLRYSVPLSKTLFKQWATIGECVDHVASSSGITKR